MFDSSSSSVFVGKGSAVTQATLIRSRSVASRRASGRGCLPPVSTFPKALLSSETEARTAWLQNQTAIPLKSKFILDFDKSALSDEEVADKKLASACYGEGR